MNFVVQSGPTRCDIEGAPRDWIAMAGSSVNGKTYTAAVLRTAFEAKLIQRVVDVGAGCGTYLDLLGPLSPEAHWTAIEVWEPYLAEYALDERYHEVIVRDARDTSFPNLRPDLVIFGDVIEHMHQDEAVAMVRKALSASPYVMISIPIITYPQHEIESNPFQRHIKEDWSHSEICASFPDVVVTCFVHNSIGVYLLSQQPPVRARIVEAHRQVAPLMKELFQGEIIIFGDMGT